MKKSLIAFTYLEVAIFRLIIAFIILSPWFRSSIKNLQKQHVFSLLVVSLIGTVLPAILFAKAQIYLNSSLAGMLNVLTPIFTLLFGIILFYQKNWTKHNLMGITIGLVGSYILINPTTTNLINTKYSLMIIIATICYAISINTIKEKLHSLRPLDIAVLSSFFSCILPLFYLIIYNPIDSMNKVIENIAFFYYLIILGAICTSFAIVLFNFLIKKSTALFASSTTYLIPIFAVIWGVIDSETIELHEIMGMIIILVGVFIMNHQKLE